MIDKKTDDEKTASLEVLTNQAKNQQPSQDAGGAMAADIETAIAEDSGFEEKWQVARVGLVQMCSGRNPKSNIRKIIKFIKEAKERKVGLVAFPEVCNIMEADKDRAWEVLFYESDDPYLVTIRELAKSLGIWVLLGSYLVKAESDTNERKFYNRSLLISSKGAIVGRYDKIHLFDVALSDDQTYRESESVMPGNVIITADSPFPALAFGKLGLSICYDVRFPYLYRKLNHLGAGIIFVPAAFTVPTGRAHWHSLLRARAIENACWIIAPAQVGTHPDGRKTYGHSLVVSPWGKIVAEAKNKWFFHNQLMVVELDEDAMRQARKQIPAYRPHLDYNLS